MAPLFLLLLTFFTGSLSVRYIVSMPVTKAARLHQIVENTDLKIVRAIGPPGFYLVEAPDEDHPHVHSLRGHVDSMEKEVPLRRKTRLVDPSMNDAWYLTGTTHFGSAVPVTLNATQVWSHDKKGRGKGINICIVDDALGVEHDDIKPNFRADLSRSMCGDETNVNPPSSSYGHGHMAAAVAAGVHDNGVCGSGVAPEAGISAVRLLSCPMSDADEATALSYKCVGPPGQRNDVFSSSWGPYDDGKRRERPGRATQAAMEYCIAEGRDGKGSVYVVAGGNGYANYDNENWDRYANSRYSIAVAAATDMGVGAYYSEPGASIMVTAGSNGGPRGYQSGIATAKYNPASQKECGWFGGTSAAAPQVAGLVAAILSERPELTWRDVQHVLAESAVPLDLDNAIHPWIQNAAGHLYSNRYGFGQINLNRTLAKAASWPLVGPEKTFCSSPRDAHQAKITRSSGPLEFQTVVNPHISKIESVALRVNMDFAGSESDLGRIRLTSPSGTHILMIGRNAHTDKQMNWEFTALGFLDEPSDGTWKVLMENVGRHSMTLNNIELCVYGQ